MMRIIGPLRGQEQPCRVVVVSNTSKSRVYFQVTAPREMEEICRGRPIEELPRIVSIWGPSQHVVSALALDRVFDVRIPPAAVNLRQAFMLADRFSHHLNKFFFLFSAAIDRPQNGFPLVDSRTRALCRQIRNEVMYTRAISQEAMAIFGARCVHPVSCVAGGMAKSLGKDQVERLMDIAARCSNFAGRLCEFFHEMVVEKPRQWAMLFDMEIPRMPPAILSGDGSRIELMEPAGSREGGSHFTVPLAHLTERIPLYHVPWSYEPFPYIRDRGRPDFEASLPQGLFFVGPLARLMTGGSREFKGAETERKSFMDFLGSAPGIPVVAGYWAQLVELLETADAMEQLYSGGKLLENPVRVVPEKRGEEGCGAAEGPDGLVIHRYQVDSRGLVRNIAIYDPERLNNGFRCFLANDIVNTFSAAGYSPESLKRVVEICFMPF